MDKNKDPMDQIIIEDLLNEAEKIDEEIAGAGMPKMPEDVKARIKGRLDKQIEAYEKERIYAQLPEEDKKALELGRKMLEQEEAEKAETKSSGEVVVYHKKKLRVFIAVAAVALLVLAMGITSVGGPQRVIEMMRVMISGREVVRVDTEEDNYIVTNEDEEAAYQELKDMFGVDPVKPQHWPEGTAFVTSNIDKRLLNAVLVYEYNGENIIYYISAGFTNSSLGMDIEDKITDNYYIDSKAGKIEIREYETEDSKTKRYSASYSMKSLDYFLIGTMEKEDFEILIKNLKFF